MRNVTNKFSTFSFLSELERSHSVAFMRARGFHQGGLYSGEERSQRREPDRDWLQTDPRSRALWESIDDTLSPET